MPRKQNQFADILSRNPVEKQHYALDDQDRMLLPDMPFQTPVKDQPTPVLYHIGGKFLMNEIALSQKTGQKMTKLAQECTSYNQLPQHSSRELIFLQRNKVSEGVLRQKASTEWKLAVPEALKEQVLAEYYDWSGHPGSDKIYRAMQGRFYWVWTSEKMCNSVVCARVQNRPPEAWLGYDPINPLSVGNHWL